ncbi:alkanal monooxygenase (FMN-linked) [Actinoplanes sp. SE50]|uniref:LLM class flavin-dependent oxidoreductase n=1 Tax=unclassified Actinoplanes TaxID=2626549 RepID=UPI00023ED18B|nr:MULTISPECIES: LLM class flavin-dependent oxidoreductase [unclassified Actinoplanes]AEV81647.1 alkanal monooxygenase (FMN-linked) [Actinoplanes sp. SE50/110]ATO80048.1 alkanal monooxygenase (FMN-linked) [Actinoplanes sp. SE50]SLL97452.1 alkanal monooxygenase (FMN-linked) [Actinoplanes sp. SE50/110]
MTRVPLSVLDLATVREGHGSADALRGTIATARAADELGYARFWVAEHHNMPAVASTSPPVLIGAVAAQTGRIRVGSGGVMLPNHMPFVVAEQFALLEALYPGRVDLGIGRAPGTDQATAAALRGVSPHLTVERFPEHLRTVLGLLGDARVAGAAGRLHATPAPETYPQVWILGSSTYGAQVAAALGLPFCYAYHFAIAADVDAALQLYRSGFQPSPGLPEPHVMVSASVIAAETTEEAEFLAGPSRIMALSLRTGRLGPIISPEQAATRELSDLDRQMLHALPGTQYAGTADEVVAGLDALVARTGADELMLAGTVYDPETRRDTLARIAKAWGR